MRRAAGPRSRPATTAATRQARTASVEAVEGRPPMARTTPANTVVATIAVTAPTSTRSAMAARTSRARGQRRPTTRAPATTAAVTAPTTPIVAGDDGQWASSAVAAVAQIVATLGYGHIFPWSVPGILSGLSGADRPRVGVLGYALVVVVGSAGIVGTMLWWRNADQNR